MMSGRRFTLRSSGSWIPVALTGLALAFGVFALEWLEYRFWARTIGIEAFIVIVGAACIALGIWLGVRLTRQAPPAPFQRNDAALAALGITPREYDVLLAMTAGDGNKAMARSLGVSPNTVKTHIARLFDKLEVSSRVQALERARLLRLIPGTGDAQGDTEGGTRHPDG